MNQYLDLLEKIKSEGDFKGDRTGTGTYSIFGAQMRFDLAKGFPLLTTKKVHLKAIIHELLWFLKGDTNIKYLTDNNVHIWDEWRMPWTSERQLILVDKKKFTPIMYNGDYSYRGINAEAGSIDNMLANTWVKMMRRCYDKDAHNFIYYGNKGITVCERWHNPLNFIEDVKTIPHWYYKQQNWDKFQLDKDYYGSDQYNIESCIWLPNEENVASEPVGIRYPNGNEEWFLGLTHAEKETGISRSSLHRFLTEGLPEILKGNNKKVIGWEFMTTIPNNKLLRRKLIPDGNLGPVYGSQWRSWPGLGEFGQDNTIDQIANVIQQIKTNPNSRRLIVTAWNPAVVDEQALPPCHCLFQFYVSQGKLSCQLYQRSADMFLGVPFNIASYSLLTMMIAQVCGLDVGEFIWTGGDCHIYSNHHEQVELQLTRGTRSLPFMHINAERIDIDTFQYGDFTLTGYDPHPAIKAPVAV